MIVEGDGLLLRRWTVADVPQVAAVAVDPLVALWNPMSLGTATQWCESRADWSDGQHASWAVIHPAEPELVLGSVSLYAIDSDQRSSEVGFWVSPEHRRQRVGTRALRAATRYAFDQLRLSRVVLFHAVANPGSCGVATAAEYALEGVHRQSHRYGDGAWHDEHSHACLVGDQPR